jgi:hypothetical protein
VKYALHIMPLMMKKTLLLLATTITACGMASASTLVVSASGKFSSSDAADSPLVAPNGVFSIAFEVNSNPTPALGSVTSLSFDVPVINFAYDLNNVPVSMTPSEITFNTLANGGLFGVTFGSGFTASQFEFLGAQAFSGTTAAPVMTTGNYAVSGWTFSDPNNFDDGTAGATASVAVAPEPSTIFLITGGLAVLVGRRFRKG